MESNNDEVYLKHISKNVTVKDGIEKKIRALFESQSSLSENKNIRKYDSKFEMTKNKKLPIKNSPNFNYTTRNIIYNRGTSIPFAAKNLEETNEKSEFIPDASTSLERLKINKKNRQYQDGIDLFDKNITSIQKTDKPIPRKGNYSDTAANETKIVNLDITRLKNKKIIRFKTKHIKSTIINCLWLQKFTELAIEKSMINYSEFESFMSRDSKKYLSAKNFNKNTFKKIKIVIFDACRCLILNENYNGIINTNDMLNAVNYYIVNEPIETRNIFRSIISDFNQKNEYKRKERFDFKEDKEIVLGQKELSKSTIEEASSSFSKSIDSSGFEVGLSNISDIIFTNDLNYFCTLTEESCNEGVNKTASCCQFFNIENTEKIINMNEHFKYHSLSFIDRSNKHNPCNKINETKNCYEIDYLKISNNKRSTQKFEIENDDDKYKKLKEILSEFTDISILEFLSFVKKKLLYENIIINKKVETSLDCLLTEKIEVINLINKQKENMDFIIFHVNLLKLFEETETSSIDYYSAVNYISSLLFDNQNYLQQNFNNEDVTKKLSKWGLKLPSLNPPESVFLAIKEIINNFLLKLTKNTNEISLDIKIFLNENYNFDTIQHNDAELKQIKAYFTCFHKTKILLIENIIANLGTMQHQENFKLLFNFKNNFCFECNNIKELIDMSIAFYKNLTSAIWQDKGMASRINEINLNSNEKTAIDNKKSSYNSTSERSQHHCEENKDIQIITQGIDQLFALVSMEGMFDGSNRIDENRKIEYISISLKEFFESFKVKFSPLRIPSKIEHARVINNISKHPMLRKCLENRINKMDIIEFHLHLVPMASIFGNYNYTAVTYCILSSFLSNENTLPVERITSREKVVCLLVKHILNCQYMCVSECSSKEFFNKITEIVFIKPDIKNANESFFNKTYMSSDKREKKAFHGIFVKANILMNRFGKYDIKPLEKIEVCVNFISKSIDSMIMQNEDDNDAIYNIANSLSESKRRTFPLSIHLNKKSRFIYFFKNLFSLKSINRNDTPKFVEKIEEAIPFSGIKLKDFALYFKTLTRHLSISASKSGSKIIPNNFLNILLNMFF